MVDISVISSLLVALGTLSLAFVTYKSLKTIQKQERLLFHQSNFLRIQQTPLLKIEGIDFKKNEIYLRLKNVGNGIATQMGIQSNFYILNKVAADPPDEKTKEEVLKKKGISKEQWEATKSFFGKEMWFRFVWNYKKILFTEKHDKQVLGIKIPFLKRVSEAHPSTQITFLKGIEDDSSLLEPGITREYICEPVFGAEVGKGLWIKDKRLPEYYKRMGLPELIEICKNNDIDIIGFNFWVVYKDLADNIGMSEQVGNFVLNVKRHTTLEEAKKEGDEISISSLTQSDLEKKVGSISGSIYHESKSMVNSPEWFDKEWPQ